MSLRINHTTIGDEAIHAELQYHPAASLDEAREAAARALAVRELLRQRADEVGIAADADVEVRIGCLIEREVRVPEPDGASCRRYFEQNRTLFHTPHRYEVSHILIPLDPTAPARRAREQAERKAAALIAEIASDPARFAAVAAQHSACPSREMGGEAGIIGPGQTVAEFEAVLERLTAGEIARRPVNSRYGAHIVYLRRQIPGQPLSYEQVAVRIRDYLAQQARRRAVAQYLSLLAGAAEIDGVDLGASTSPLVQ